MLEIEPHHAKRINTSNIALSPIYAREVIPYELLDELRVILTILT